MFGEYFTGRDIGGQRRCVGKRCQTVFAITAQSDCTADIRFIIPKHYGRFFDSVGNVVGSEEFCIIFRRKRVVA
jgi:hypothetical protein